MPKFGSHIIFATEARARRPDLFPNINENALRLGAVGPDTTLFLFDPATSNPQLRKGVEIALDVLETIQDIKVEFEKVVDAIQTPVGDLADWITGGLYYDLRYTVNAGIEAMKLALTLGISMGTSSLNVKNPIFSKLGQLPADFIKDPANSAEYWTISSVDNFGFPFRMFGHPFTDDGAWKSPEPAGDYSNWWWMDLLHYRKTGKFASRLLVNAQTDVEKSYALGYMTHVGGDVCGHPFINALVGGPFRNHAYRHLVLETLADSWLWEQQGRGPVLGARFDQLIDLDPSQEAQVASLVVRTMKEVYHSPMIPRQLANGYPTEDEWLGAYKLMQQYLRLSTSTSVERPVPPPDGLEEIWEEMKDLLGKNNPGPFPKWNGDAIDFLKALLSWFGKGATLLAMLATLPVAVVTRILTVAPRWMIYLINLGTYYIISALRAIICLTGWGYCSGDDFKIFGFLEDMITTNNFDDGVPSYPFMTLPNPKTPFYWLGPPRMYPMSRLEPERTVAMSPPLSGLKPSWTVDPANAMNLAAVNRFIDSISPEETRNLEFAAENGIVFGNAVDFSNALLDGTVRVADFDLDGDRGFGFRGWEELPPNERYV